MYGVGTNDYEITFIASDMMYTEITQIRSSLSKHIRNIKENESIIF
jgi:hypothetical protein